MKLERKAILSTLWIFVLFNFAFADIFTAFFDPAARPETLSMTAGTVIAFAVLMEAGIVMVLLSRILKQRVNRAVNVIAAVIQAAFVSWSLFGQAPRPHYVFFVCIEIAALLSILVYAWTWKAESAPSDRVQ